MESLARVHPDVAFAFVYVREAHPGERIGTHRCLDDKLHAAKQFGRRWRVQRPILVDDLKGSLHEAYGLLPNMAYVVNQRGRVAYRADWTDAHAIDVALRYLSGEAVARGEGQRVAPFYSEILGHRAATDYPRVFIEGLWTGGGERAVEEFIAAAEQHSAALAQRMRKAWLQLKDPAAP